MKDRLPMRTTLCRGQALHMYAKRGTHIVAVRGAIEFAGAPAWLDGQMARRQIFLREGDAHRVQDSGWIAVSARTDAEVFCSVATDSPARIAGALALLAAGWRRLAGPRARVEGNKGL